MRRKAFSAFFDELPDYSYSRVDRRLTTESIGLYMLIERGGMGKNLLPSWIDPVIRVTARAHTLARRSKSY